MASRHGTCRFCGEIGKLTVEDALPKWIGRAFAAREPTPRGAWTRHRVIARDNRPTHRHQRRVGNPSSYKVPLICEVCNGGWMKQLEDEVKPFLEPMIFGEFAGDNIELSPGQMYALAKWMTKTTLAFDLLEADTQIALPSDRKWLSTQERPFPESRIWIAAVEDDLVLVAHFRRTRERGTVDNPPKVIPPIQMFTLVLGYVVLQSLVASGSRVIPLGRRRPMPNDMCAELWPALAPNDGPISWPSPFVHTNVTLNEFTKIVPGDADIPIE